MPGIPQEASLKYLSTRVIDGLDPEELELKWGGGAVGQTGPLKSSCFIGPCATR